MLCAVDGGGEGGEGGGAARNYETAIRDIHMNLYAANHGGAWSVNGKC